MPEFAITGEDDPRLAPYRVVRDPDLARERGCFVAEGREVVRRLLVTRGADVQSVLLTPPARAALADVLARDAPHVEVLVVPVAVMAAATGFNFHRGCLALARRSASGEWTQVAQGGPGVIVVGESLGNPDNVGALFRTAQALGARAVLLSPACCDPWYRKAVRTSMGAVFQVPWAWARPWPECLAELRHGSVDVVALTPAHDAPEIDDVLATAGPRVALVVGNEGRGLSASATALATARARIPLAAGTDSLNVTAAAAIALYLASRGRPTS